MSKIQLFLNCFSIISKNENKIPINLYCISIRVHSWADKLGMELFHLGDFITRRKEVQEVFDINFLDNEFISTDYFLP